MRLVRPTVGKWALAAAGLTLAACQHAPSGFTPAAQPGVSTAKPILGGPETFRFAIVSDRTGGARAGVFERAIAALNLLQPDFVIGVGDLVEGYTADPQALAGQWRALDAIVGGLDMRFFYVAGNHDLSNAAMVEFWRARSGRPYYSFVYKDALFLVLDTDDPPAKSSVGLPDMFPEPGRAAKIEAMLKSDPRRANEIISERLQALQIPLKQLTPASISDEQVEWIRHELDANRGVRWTFVFLHKPAWLYGNANFERIDQLLAARPYTLFAGHEHYYQYSRRKGHDHLQLGTTGGEWIRKGPGALDHVTWVTMTGNGPTIANIRVDGVFGKEGPPAPAPAEAEKDPRP